MAGQNERRNIDRRKDTSMGHEVMWELTVADLVHLQSRPFKKIFRTTCEKSPSAWRFEMSLPEVREDGTCSLSVMLKRTDDLDLYLEAVIWIDICDPSDKFIFGNQTFTQTGMLPGNSIQETVEMTPLPDMRDAIHRNAKVRVILMICFCHSDYESD